MPMPKDPEKAARLRTMAEQTLSGERQQGWFIPYRYADQQPPAPQDYPALFPFFERAEDMQQAVIERMDHYAAELEGFNHTKPPLPRWQQDWFPRADGAAAYTLLRDLQPKSILEVGSGHSTRFMAKAVADGGFACKITCVDPAPRADISALPQVRLIRDIIQNVTPGDLPVLEAGDILFIDSSHIAMPGSDLDHMLLTLIPSLPVGSILHIHDICLPLGYPANWDWRGYNEQTAIAPLLYSDGWEILWASHYMINRRAELWQNSILNRLPLKDNAPETSLWLRRI